MAGTSPHRAIPGLVSAALAMVLFVSATRSAAAHVTVLPDLSSPGAEVRYTVRVPTERPVATVAVRLVIPDEVIVAGFLPTPGWTREVERGPQQQVVAVVWSGGAIQPGEFLEFDLLGRNPRRTRDLTWPAYQTYADGQIVEWTGGEQSSTPAAVTHVDSTVSDNASIQLTPTARLADRSATTESDLPLVLGLVAVVLAAAALVLSGVALARSRRTDNVGD